MIPLRCAGCGAGLEIDEGMKVFACAYCGISQQVERRGGTVSLKRLETVVNSVNLSTQRIASELALPRLERELQDVERERSRLLEAAQKEAKPGMGWVVVVCLAFVALGVYELFKWNLGWVSVWFILAYFSGSLLHQGPEVAKRINNTADAKARRIKEQLAAHRDNLDA